MTFSDICGHDRERLDSRIAKQKANIKGRMTGVTRQQKRDMVRYLEAGIAVGRKRDELLLDLAEAFGRGDRQIERYVQSVGRETQRRVDKMREEHCRVLAWTAGLLRGNAAKLLNAPRTFSSFPMMSFDYAIVGSILLTVPGFDPLSSSEEKIWHVDPSSATCLLAHLKREFPKLEIDDWWAVKKENITPGLVKALESLAARRSFAPAEACSECRAIEETAQA